MVEKPISANAAATLQADALKMMRTSTFCSSLPAKGEATVMVRYMMVTYSANEVVGMPRASDTTGWNNPQVEKQSAEHPNVIMMPVRTTSR